MYNEAIALYLRLSKEDDDKKIESESIKNQRDFLTEYVEKLNCKVSEIYIDDGYSGTNFERPDFKRLISDIDTGKINTVITKDLSRLGRDYIQTGYFLEKYFPSKGVRFIAVNDGIDTSIEDSGNNDMSPFRSVINDMYAKDISKKVRTALTTKKKNRKFIGSFAPYGYKKDPNDNGHLIIDEDTAPIVREIFKLYLEETSFIGIAKRLTNENVPTPSQSKQKLPTQKRFKGLWNDVIIRRILTNETYIGNLTQNRSRKISYKVDKKINLTEKDWIIVPNTHEGIIVKEDYEAVQKILSTRSYLRKDSAHYRHLLSGIIFCGDCGAPMTFIKESPERTYLACSTWRRYGKLGLCTSHCIRENYVEKVIRDNLRELAKELEIKKVVNHIIEENSDRELLLKQFDKLIKKGQFHRDVQLNLYKDKVQGVLLEKQFLEMQQRLIEEDKEVEYKLEELREKIDNQSSLLYQEQRIMQFLDFNKIERNALLLLVGKVRIFNDKKIDIIFNFKNTF